jgi:hypothetical protein
LSRPGRICAQRRHLLRHANLNSSAIYGQVADEKRIEAIDRLDPFG